jgi:hypothetical protein
VGRIYNDDESRFAKWFREDKLFELRNGALYMEFDKGKVVVPAQSISRSDAHLLVCIAGEVLGEMQGPYLGTSADEWENVLAEVDEFRGTFSP